MAFRVLLKRKKNAYGYTVCVCPIRGCTKEMHKHSKSLHFSSKAKMEAVEKALGLRKKTPHLDFYLKYTREVIVRKRVWKVTL